MNTGITITIALVAGLSLGFAIGQRTTCFDFFGLSKACVVTTGR